MLSFLLPGWFLKRREARRFAELLFHEPPRRLDRTPLSMIHHLSWHLTKPGGFPPLPSRSKRVSCRDRKSTRLNSSHLGISYAVFCLKKKRNPTWRRRCSRGTLADSRCTSSALSC